MAAPLFNRSSVHFEVAEDILGTQINEHLTQLCEQEAVANPDLARVAELNAKVDELFSVRRGLAELQPAQIQQVINQYGGSRNPVVR